MKPLTVSTEEKFMQDEQLQYLFEPTSYGKNHNYASSETVLTPKNFLYKNTGTTLITTNTVDEYLVGDWNGDGRDNIAVRRGNQIWMDYNFDRYVDRIQAYGNGNGEDEYLVGDWNGDGRDNIAVRRGNQIVMDYDYDGVQNLIQAYGNGNGEDEYLVGDWNGDGRDNIAVRRSNQIVMDYDYDGSQNLIQGYGNGNGEDEYLVGDWNGDGRDNIAVRRGNEIVMDYDYDGSQNLIQAYGNGNGEDEYLVGDWNGDGRDNIAVRRGNQIVMDYDYDGVQNLIQIYSGSVKNSPSPKLSISDVTLFEGNSGTTNARFTVTLTGRAEDPVSVRYSTSNGTARSGSDFISKAGRLTFRTSNQSRQTQTITIPVKGDRTFEGNETFRVGLSNATNAQIRDNRGTGTIRNDDNRNNRLSFGNSVNYMGEVFEDIKDVWSSSRNSATVPYFQDDLFGSIAVDSNFI